MPGLVACAVVHDDPPQVFIADDIETLNWVLALRLIASTRGSEVPTGLRDSLRTALIRERWGEAVELWMELRPGHVDVYPSYDLHLASELQLAAEELQFTPLFRD